MASILWTASHQFSGRTARAAAALGDIPIQQPVNYEHFVDNKKPEFLAKFPHGKIPAFEQPDGFKLFESTAIIRYVAGMNLNTGLLGKNPQEAALIDQWMHLSELEVDVNTHFSFLLLNGSITPYNKSLHNTFIERQRRALRTLNDHLSTRTFFVGERITLADIYIASQICRAATITLDAAARAEFYHLIRHLETIIHQPQLEDIFESISFVEKALQYAPPFKEKEPSAALPKTEKKYKMKDGEEVYVPPEFEAKNPLDDIPESTFNFEDWRHQYFNNTTRGAGGSLEWFSKNFDPQGFSVWRVDFKHNDKLTQTSVEEDQIGGFFSRLEASRKYLFGSAGVANNSVIAGALMICGLDVRPVVEVAPDWESYSYKKLDLSHEEDKTFFEAALAWDLEIDGKKWTDGNNFK